MNKATRQRIYDKYHGHCAYCGAEIALKGMHVDHLQPAMRHLIGAHGSDDESNLMPSCARCNLWKRSYTLEEFRNEIYATIPRLRMRSPQYRLALDFHQIEELGEDVKFYFEKAEADHD